MKDFAMVVDEHCTLTINKGELGNNASLAD